jgi:hypothetical protein
VSDEVSVTLSRPLAQQDLIAKGATWRYLDNGSEQGTAWRGVNFVDTAWKSGVAPLGYGDPVTTTVDFGPNSTTKYMTTYFRHAFNLQSANNVISMVVSLRRDDGAIVYLNGVEIMRSNMPEGAANSTTPASNAVGGGDETAYFSIDVDPSILVAGKNVVAVELHQANPTSTDLSFDLDLVGLVNASNTAPTANAGPDLVVQMPASATLTGEVHDDALPNPPGVLNVSWSMVSGPGSVSFANANMPQTTATFSQAGTYVLRLNATDGQLSASDDLQVTVTGGADSYELWRSEHFTAAELSNSSISGDNADPDGDSVRNRDEYIAGTNPKNNASFLHVMEVSRESDDFAIRFEAVGNKSYTILGRDAVESGLWERVLDLSPQGNTELIEVLDTMPQANRKKFYRVVTPQIPPQ